MKKLQSALLLIGVGFLGYLLWRTGPNELWRELRLLGWGIIPVLLSEGIAEMIHTIGWRYCLSGAQRTIPWRRLFPIRMAGYAINYLTPTAALGGEATKAALLAAYSRGPEAVSGVLIGKLCFAFAHLLFAVGGSLLVLWKVKLPLAMWAAMLISSAAVGTGMAIFLALQRGGRLGSVVRWFVNRRIGGARFERLATNITQVDSVLRTFYRERPGDLVRAICWHLVGYSLGIAQTWYFLFLLTPNASWLTAAVVWFLGMWFDLVTFAIPLNAGSLEGTRIVTLKAVGADALLGMTYGVALRLAMLFWSGFGLVCYAWLTVRKTRSTGQDDHLTEEPRDNGSSAQIDKEPIEHPIPDHQADRVWDEHPREAENNSAPGRTAPAGRSYSRSERQREPAGS
jgi:uncharacterized protein (TIRG00374 family)